MVRKNSEGEVGFIIYCAFYKRFNHILALVFGESGTYPLLLSTNVWGDKELGEERVGIPPGSGEGQIYFFTKQKYKSQKNLSLGVRATQKKDMVTCGW